MNNAMNTEMTPEELEDWNSGLSFSIWEYIAMYGCERRSASFRSWCKVLWDTFYAHGEDLHLLLAPPWSSYEAEQLLKAGVAAGWFQKGKNPEPSRQQQYFGSGGLWEGDLRKHPEHRPMTHFGFAPNRANTDLDAFVHGAPAHPPFARK